MSAPRSPAAGNPWLGWALRYGSAVLAVVAGFALRRAIEAGVGPGLPTFITFYPLVMLVALLAGLGPGLVTTVVTIVVVETWINPPLGEFSVLAPVDRFALALFGGMGLFMSAVAGQYRRFRKNLAIRVAERTRELLDANAALKQQVELVDPARAAVIASEMQRVLRLRREVPAVPPPQRSGQELGRIPGLAGGALMALGLLVLLGWATDIDTLQSVVPGLATMKANTAVCFALAGAALLLRDRRTWRTACGAILCAVAALTLCEYLFGCDLGLDQLLFRDPGHPETVHPGRMVWATALGFLMSGVSGLLLGSRTRPGRWLQQALAVGVAAVGAMAMLGYLYDVSQLYRFAGRASMALPTSFGFVALAAGLAFAPPDGLGSVLTSSGSGAQMARRLMPAAILLPLLFGGLHEIGERIGLFSPAVGAGLFALAMMASFVAAIGWIAQALDRADAVRRETETQLQSQAQLMDYSQDALIIREMGGAIRFWNNGAAALYGWTAAEALGQRIHVLLRTEGLPPDHESWLEQTGHWEGVIHHTARNGRRISVETRKTALRAADGRLLILESNRDITERKQAGEALQRERDLLQAVMNGAKNSHLVYLDREFNFVRVNETYAATCGYRPEEMIGKNHFVLYPHAENEAIFARVRDTGEPFSIYDKPFEFPDHPERGTTYWDWALTPVKDPAGQVEGLIFSLYETTAHKQAEEQLRKSATELQAANAELRTARRAAINVMDDAVEARRQAEQAGAELRESEARYRSLFNSMNEGFAVHEILVDAGGEPTDYRFLDINLAFEKLTGLKRADVVGRTVRQVLPNIEPKWIRTYGRVALTGESTHFEDYDAVLGRHYEVFSYCPAPKQFAAVFLDVTVRKEAEAVLRRSRDELDRLVRERTAALTAAEGKYRELVENANSLILRITPRQTIAFFNEYAESFFGFAEAEVLGQSLVGTIVPETDSEGRDLRALMRDLTTRPELHPSGENENVRKDGSRVWIHWTNRAIRDPQGRVVEILSVGADITERKRMQRENERYQERLRALAERLVASEERERWDISRYIHDTIIQNLSLSSMRMGTAQKTLAKAGLDREIANLQTTRRLVDDAIAECRTVMSELTPSLLYELGLVPALKELADLILQRHGIRVSIEEVGQSRSMEAPLRGLLFQSVRELVMNALKHAGPCEIRVEVIHAAAGVTLHVHDNGKGFDPARMDGGGAPSGGFGLFSVRQRVEGMGGRLEIASAPGQGTTASIALAMPSDP